MFISPNDATFMQIEWKQPAHGPPRNDKLFLDSIYINLVKLYETACEKVNF